MSRRVVRSDLALADLAELAESIRQHNSSAALRFLDAAEATFRVLASMPGMGERYETGNPLDQELRCFPISKFPKRIVYYKPVTDGVVIIRVLHGARDRDQIFGKEDEPKEE
jgi:toxin ParE1/3/4